MADSDTDKPKDSDEKFSIVRSKSVGHDGSSNAIDRLLKISSPKRKDKDLSLRDLVESDEIIRGKFITSDIYAAPSTAYTFPYKTIKDFGVFDESVLVGRLQYKCGGPYVTDCTQVGCGVSVPYIMHDVTDITSDALFILVVEDEVVFHTLSRIRYFDRIPCIIISSMGHYRGLIGLFLRKLKMALNLPILALVDCDLEGLERLSFYRHGGGDVTGYLDVKWLGFKPSDLENYQILESFRENMMPEELNDAKKLLEEEEFATQNPDCVHELELMVKMGKTAKLLALISNGGRADFLYNVYLPLKLQHKDWL